MIFPVSNPRSILSYHCAALLPAVRCHYCKTIAQTGNGTAQQEQPGVVASMQVQPAVPKPEEQGRSVMERTGSAKSLNSRWGEWPGMDMTAAQLRWCTAQQRQGRSQGRSQPRAPCSSFSYSGLIQASAAVGLLSPWSVWWWGVGEQGKKFMASRFNWCLHNSETYRLFFMLKLVTFLMRKNHETEMPGHPQKWISVFWKFLLFWY